MHVKASLVPDHIPAPASHSATMLFVTGQVHSRICCESMANLILAYSHESDVESLPNQAKRPVLRSKHVELLGCYVSVAGLP